MDGFHIGMHNILRKSFCCCKEFDLKSVFRVARLRCQTGSDKIVFRK